MRAARTALAATLVAASLLIPATSAFAGETWTKKAPSLAGETWTR